jgi:uncharacterized protein (DUF58 family)
VASEIAALLDAGSRVALRTDDSLIDAGAGARHRARLLTHLALVEPRGNNSQPTRAEPGDDASRPTRARPGDDASASLRGERLAEPT